MLACSVFFFSCQCVSCSCCFVSRLPHLTFDVSIDCIGQYSTASQTNSFQCINDSSRRSTKGHRHLRQLDGHPSRVETANRKGTIRHYPRISNSRPRNRSQGTSFSFLSVFPPLTDSLPFFHLDFRKRSLASRCAMTWASSKSTQLEGSSRIRPTPFRWPL